jgi:hypothetical protein
MKLTIDRNTWLRGEGSVVSRLLRKDDGKKCCLGFYMNACGVSDSEIEEVRLPSDLDDIPNEAAWLVEKSNIKNLNVPSPIAFDLMQYNDASSQFGREEEITKIFKEAGVEVEFVN